MIGVSASKGHASARASGSRLRWNDLRASSRGQFLAWTSASIMALAAGMAAGPVVTQAQASEQTMWRVAQADTETSEAAPPKS